MLRAVKNTPAVLLANGLSGHYPYENIFIVVLFYLLIKIEP